MVPSRPLVFFEAFIERGSGGLCVLHRSYSFEERGSSNDFVLAAILGRFSDADRRRWEWVDIRRHQLMVPN